jgi:ABC-type polysaccharide/polyol phosphate export permease
LGKSVMPCPWRIDHSHQGWKKAFYLNPIPYLNDSFQQPVTQNVLSPTKAVGGAGVPFTDHPKRLLV